MKKTIAAVLTGLLLTSCASSQAFKASDVTDEGIRYKYGAKQGIVLGDKIYAYRKASRSKGPAIFASSIGSLTITKVETDYSFMKKDTEFELNEQIVFKK